ncbi:MAG: pirin family protein [Candidatus Dadabacteria bacterium]|nr:pirin family protein [Candidatus Dadabacteria bacterium]NIS08324.1 pirin family protein [Candidatus Dadabacteria bacterium]NIV41748.1 pirin family protein [Candidatus Dadabacteria bacterium]NIX15196.1 pirin family protein [Candidatus Dadabacteria bacterium]NIY21841.1 pirin family protein [Candidatus Dadabacteria bacterium]
MIRIRKAEDRGRTEIDWLDTYHSFSFGEYYDPDNMGFGYLRVINDDKIKPSMGFGTHPHRDMEIITVMLAGQLAHKDSMGNGSVIKKGDIQKMTAGSGIMHSEFNGSDSEEAHLLQIWITPNKMGLEPGYEQISINELKDKGEIKLIASGDAENGIIRINQNVDLYYGKLDTGSNAEFSSDDSHKIWVQMIKGKVEINGTELKSADGAAITDTDILNIESKENSEFLIFEMK